MQFRIEPNKLITTGIKTVNFDPNKIKELDVDTYQYGSEKTATKTFVYNDVEIAQLILDLRYSLNWGENKRVFINGEHRDRTTGLFYSKTIEAKLRKKPKSDHFTEKSLKEFEEKVKLLEENISLDKAKENFKLAVEGFNTWYVEEQTKAVINTYSDSGKWKFDNEKVLEDVDSEIKELENKLGELQEKRHNMKYDMLLEHVEKEDNNISEDFKTPLVDAMRKMKSEGYRTRWF